MAIGPNDIKEWQIRAAFKFIQSPMSERFRAWSTLRERDNVTMTMWECAHLMAWFAELQKALLAGDIKRLQEDIAARFSQGDQKRLTDG